MSQCVKGDNFVADQGFYAVMYNSISESGNAIFNVSGFVLI